MINFKDNKFFWLFIGSLLGIMATGIYFVVVYNQGSFLVKSRSKCIQQVAALPEKKTDLQFFGKLLDITDSYFTLADVKKDNELIKFKLSDKLVIIKARQKTGEEFYGKEFAKQLADINNQLKNKKLTAKQIDALVQKRFTINDSIVKAKAAKKKELLAAASKNEKDRVALIKEANDLDVPYVYTVLSKTDLKKDLEITVTANKEDDGSYLATRIEIFE